jgi:hypothetical protein
MILLSTEKRQANMEDVRAQFVPSRLEILKAF